MKILFICTGNICRSPMAELLAKNMTATTPDISVDSAGIRGLPGHPIDPTAGALLTHDGIHVEDFRSKRVDSMIVRQADLILCFARNHRSEIAVQFPTALRKTFLLDEYAELANYYREHDMATARSSMPDRLHEIMDNATMIKPLIPTGSEIEDPHGQTIETFRRVHDRITTDLARITQI